MLLYLINVIQFLADLYMLVLFMRVMISWLSADPYNPIVQFICRITNPLIFWINRIIPTRVGMFDLSPMIAMLLVWLAEKIVIRLLLQLA